MNDHASLGTLLLRCRRWLAAGLLIGIAAGFLATHRVSLLPPSVEPRSATFASATTQILVDFAPPSTLADAERPVGLLGTRAIVYARLLGSPSLVGLIGKEAGIDPSRIAAFGPYNPYVERDLREPDAERRAQQLRAERQRYRLRFDVEDNGAVPLVLVYAQAPTVGEARRLADGAARALERYVVGVQDRERLPTEMRLRVTELGRAIGAVVNPSADRQIAILAFLGAFCAWMLVVLLAARFLPVIAFRGRPEDRPPPRRFTPARRPSDDAAARGRAEKLQA